MDVQELLKLAENLSQAGKYNEALIVYQQVINSGAKKEVFHRVGSIYHKTGNNREAINFLSHAVRLSPDSPEGLYDFGCALLAAGEVGRAIESFRRATKTGSASPETSILLQMLELALGCRNLRYHPPEDCQIAPLAEIYRDIFGYKSEGTFVEIGAFDGESCSNTSFLADLGWTGFYVEPVRQYAQQCAYRHARNRVKVIVSAVGAMEGEAEITIGGVLSSLSKDHIESQKKFEYGSRLYQEGKIEKVRVVTPETLFNSIGVDKFEILSLDVEGYEWQVVSNLDLSRFRPQLAIVETHDQSPSATETLIQDSLKVIEHFINSGYTIHWRDSGNIIFRSFETGLKS